MFAFHPLDIFPFYTIHNLVAFIPKARLISSSTPSSTPTSTTLSLLGTEAPIVISIGEFIVQRLDALCLLAFAEAVRGGDLEERGCCFNKPLRE